MMLILITDNQKLTTEQSEIYFFPLHNYVAGSKGMFSARIIKAPHLVLKRDFFEYSFFFSVTKVSLNVGVCK